MNTINKFLFLVLFILSGISLNAQKSFEVKIIGKGDPVLLFPGFACTGEVWNETVKELSKTNECHVFTFAGFGGLEPIETPWLTKVKEGVAKYISEKHLEKSTLIGHSLGGTLSLWLASNDVFTFNKIIVIDALPSVGALMIPNFKSEYMVYDNPYNKQMLEMKDEAFNGMATQMASGMTSNSEKQKLIRDWILMADRKTYVYGYTDLMKLDLRETIANIKAPVSILAATLPYGEETVKKTYEGQYKSLKNYSIKFAKDSAHFIMYDQPEWLINTIKQELD